MTQKIAKVLSASEFGELIERELLEAKEARKNFPSPTAIANKQAKNLSRMLHSSYGEIERLAILERIEGVPGFEGLDGLDGLDGFGSSCGLPPLSCRSRIGIFTRLVF